MKRKKYWLAIPVLLLASLGGAAFWYLHHANVQVLNAKGLVGQKERNLILFALALSLVVVVPVFTLLFTFAWRYRAGNTKAAYRPDFDHSRKLETVWWLIPTALILVLSIVTWNSSHALDPYKPLASRVPPLTIQVVALQWKWLFIYPNQHIASVNAFDIPMGTPVNFELTSDAPMNSFWLPQLGGQIYTMPGMSTQLHLVADHAGTYAGSSANISGSGFAGMTFTATATSQSGFDAWVRTAQQARSGLDAAAYSALAQPSQNNPVTYYASVQPGLYNDIIAKYMPSSPGGMQMEAP